MPLQHVVRHGKIAADAANFVFKQVFQRLDELQLHFVGQPADVVVRLNGLRRATDGARFDYIGVKRTLHQPEVVERFVGFFLSKRAFLSSGRFQNLVGFFFENRNKFVADNLALGFRLRNSAKPAQKARAGIHGLNVEAEFVSQVLLHLHKLIFAQYAVVDEDASQAGVAFFVA